MSKVSLKDVAVEVRNTIKNPYGLPVVGLEHLDPDEIELSRWDDNSENTFTKAFYKGQILFGRRRAYQKKASVATIDGVCSGDITVIAAKEGKIASELLPFVIRDDRLFDFAMEKSAGSLSPRVKWDQLSEYTFELPDDLNKQKELANIFWGFERTRKAYRAQIEKSDELIKSQFVEMFGDPVLLDKGWPLKMIGEVAETQLGKMLNAKNQTGESQHYYLANRNIQWFDYDFSDLRMMDFNEAERRKYELQYDDLLVCEGGEIGRCAIWHNEINDCYIQNAVHRVRCNINLIEPIYLGYSLFYHAQANGFSDVIGGVKVTIPHLPAEKLRTIKVAVPPIDYQRRFVTFVGQTDKSKLAAKQAVESLNALQKSLMRKHLG